MSETHWTPAQEAALNARGGNLLLSAAAGSGKTAVLVERVIRRLTDEKDPVTVDQFLILTFTRSAAAEMRSRIASTLSTRLAEAAEEYRRKPSAALERRMAYLERQLALLPSASISTIDAYCQSLLRQYFYLLDIDPGFRILSDENERYLLEDDVLSEVLLHRYEAAEPDFLLLADLFASRYQDSRLRGAILELYHFTRSLAFPEDFLAKLSQPYDVEGTETPDDFPWATPLLESFRTQAASWGKKYERINELMALDTEAFQPYGDAVGEELAAIGELISEKDQTWDAWYRVMNLIEFKRLGTAYKKNALHPETFEETKQEIQALRDDVKKSLKAIKDSYFSVAPETWARDMRETRPLVSAMASIVLDFAAAYAARKKEEGLLEFNDAEHLSLRLLLASGSTPERPLPSETALSLQKKYREVMVDEYQDTNSLQELITKLISNGRNRFLVGDLKQSIYRFRQADPGIFLEKYEAFTETDAENRRIDLNQNFRSDDAVLSCANFIFRQLLRKSEGVPLELDYGEAEALHAGRKTPSIPTGYVGGTADILLVMKPGKKEEPETDEEAEKEELEKIELEARLIARKISALMAGGLTLEKDGTYRPLRFGDIVILLRAVTGKAPMLLRELRNAGIPAVCGQQEEFFDAPEVEILRALLSVIDNPRQDLALACALRSPFVELGENALAELRLADRNCLWTALCQSSEILPPADAGRVLRFLSLYRKWRNLSRAGGIAPLLETVLSDTDYLSYWSGLPGSAFRLSRIRSLCEAARRFDKESSGGLCRFLASLADAKNSGNAIRQETAAASTGDAVRIMTIHASKGLEFPVVFLANASGKFNKKDAASFSVHEKSLGLGLYRYSPELRCCWPTLYSAAVKQASERQLLAEEARLLYVAMTRAKDKLIITGTVEKIAGALKNWTQGLAGSETDIPPLPVYKITGARSYLDWIMPAALRSRSLAELWKEDGAGIPAYVCGDARFHAELVPADSLLTAVKAADAEEEINPIRKFLSAPSKGFPETLDQKFHWTYPHAGAVRTPAKLTATAAVQLMEAEKEETMPSKVLAEPLREKAPLPPDFATPPAFLSETSEAPVGAAYGTLLHKAMDVLDLSNIPAEESAVVEAIRQAAAETRFTEDEARFLLQGTGPVTGILRFLQGPLGMLMKKADRVRKELPFSILLPAKTFYPECEAEETIFLQGAIDCLLEKDGRLVIIDYKTDRVKTGAELREHYRVQLQIYGKAMEQITEKPVEALYLWSLRLGEAVPVEKLPASSGLLPI